MTAQTATPREVLAHWAYSEIIDSNFEQFYDNVPSIEELRGKRQKGTPLSGLSPAQLDDLGAACAAVRQNLINLFFKSVPMFHRTTLSRERIEGLWVPPHVWHPQSQGRYVRFAEYQAIEPDDKSPGDSRNIVSDPESYKLPLDPLTIGQCDKGLSRRTLPWRTTACDD
jgi:hypothetical protein